jgi:hypothetical protein
MERQQKPFGKEEEGGSSAHIHTCNSPKKKRRSGSE